MQPEEASPARAALPSQLAQLLGDVAPAVAGFTSELAPGIPANKQVFQDMFRMLLTNDIYVPPADTPGFQISTRITRTFKKRVITGLNARIECYTGVKHATGNIRFNFEYPTVTAHREFPFTFAGTKAAIEFLAEEANFARRRGFCSDCLAREPPKKRLRIAGTSVCATCVLRKACA
jgi:hypothetical protein